MYICIHSENNLSFYVRIPKFPYNSEVQNFLVDFACTLLLCDGGQPPPLPPKWDDLNNKTLEGNRSSKYSYIVALMQ